MTTVSTLRPAPAPALATPSLDPSRLTVLYIGASVGDVAEFTRRFGRSFNVLPVWQPTQTLTLCAQRGVTFDLILNSTNPTSPLGLALVRILTKELYVRQPIFWLTGAPLNALEQAQLREAGVAGIFPAVLTTEQLNEHLSRAVANRSPQSKGYLGAAVSAPFHLPLGKRVFDIVVALTALLLLSPLLLVVAALIKLESRGPVLYYSYRVGTGYRVFKFWKFRSMRADADQQINALKDKNQYRSSTADADSSVVQPSLCATCAGAGKICQQQLVDAKGQFICEKQYEQTRRATAEPVFVKIADDPRVTRFGRFIRNTSLDELPQLFNVLSGAMSIVGNRPLPLYEAEKLTTDESVLRFLAPAGLTGLWQVSRRGQRAMSEAERKTLDTLYAQRHSFRQDLYILWKTIPALFQKESV